MPKVFISYSHDSEGHAGLVRGLGFSLSRDGCECPIDVHKDTGEDWPTWMTRQLVEADFVLCVATETYERRFRDKELPDAGLGVGWEANLIRRLLYAKKFHNDRIFPVVFSKSDRAHIPLELQGYDYFLLDSPAGYESLLRKVLRLPLHVKPAIGTPPALASNHTAPLFARPGDAPSATKVSNVDISRILKYAPAELIGREDETKLLNEAWAKVQNNEKGRPHILTFVALGGEGKTSLVAKWAAEMAHQDWPGCDAAFAWSFYSQGTRDQVAASSDLFLKEALTFFGDDADKEFAASSAGAHEKGQRLARIVGQRHCLLILDGLEPLQYAPTSPTPGELKDDGIRALLRGLATASHGLCVITTRYSLSNLKTFWQTTGPEVKLLRLSREAGVHLLKTFKVQGSDRNNIPFNNGKEMLSEFEKLVEDVKGHALTLNLLGSYLRDAHGGDIRKRDLISFAEADAANEHKHHVDHVMDAYVRWLSPRGIRAWLRRIFNQQEREAHAEGSRALAVLRLVGLFDRPIAGECFNALLKAPAIAGLTEPLMKFNGAQRNTVLKRLEGAKLLTVNADAAGILVSLDAHPHLREYFARQLRTQQPDAWRAAHRRLYEYLCATTKEGDQPTLEDLQPLYQAVAHGCQAGLTKEARGKVYRDRIQRGQEGYSTFVLGGLASDLGAIAYFFKQPWKDLLPGISETEQAWLLNEAAFTLRALGRLPEALDSYRAVLERDVTQKSWDEAGRSASSLSELELTLGDVTNAVINAQQAVIYADRSNDIHRIGVRAAAANALHEAGRQAEAETRFREAEQMQKERQPGHPLLYSVRGFLYCDLLLTAAERAAWQTSLALSSQSSTISSAVSDCRSVSQCAAQMLKWMEEDNRLLDIALHRLTLSHAALYEAVLIKSEIGNRRSEIEKNVDVLRRANRSDQLPRGLLTRAWLRLLTGARTGPESAQADLDEAWEIAERGPMKLFMTDIHLYRARLFFREAKYPWQSPQHDLAEAEKLINSCGYHRRDEELADAKRAILDL